MKKLGVLLIILMVLPLTIAVLDNEDHKAIESIVRREVQNSNDMMEQDLKSDISDMKAEVDLTLDQISNTATTSKLVIILALTGAVVLSQTTISFLQFLVWRKKRSIPNFDAEIERRKKDITDQKQVIRDNNNLLREQAKLIEQNKKDVLKSAKLPKLTRQERQMVKLEEQLKRLKNGNA